jgi:hypothetical protein
MLSRYFYRCASIMAAIFVSPSITVDADDVVFNRRLGHSLTSDNHDDNNKVEKIDVFGRTLYKTYWKTPGQQQKKKKKKKKTKPKVAHWNRAWQEPKPSKKKHVKTSRSAGEEGWHGVMSMLDRF